MTSRPARIVGFAIFAALLIVSATPANAATVTVSENSSAAELSSGTTSNAQVERSGEPGMVSHDVNRSSAVARYAMDYGSGSTAYDHVGGNDATINGASWVAGVRGQALDFDGNDDYVDVPGGMVSSSDPLTVSFHLTPDNTSTQQRVVSLRGDVKFTTRVSSSGTLDVWVSGNWYTGPSVTVGESVHVTITHNGSGGWKVFKNGGIATTFTATLESGLESNVIGTDAGVIGSRNLDGRVDEVRIYTETFSPGLVTRLNKFSDGKLSPAASERWALDAGQGSTAYGDAGVDASTTNATWESGKSGQALSFRGDGYANAGDVSSLEGFGDTLAISAWVKLNSTEGAQTLVSKKDVYKLDYSSGGFRFLTGENWTGSITKSSFTPKSGVWYHVVGVYNGTHKTIYINGEPNGTVSTTGSVGTSAFNVAVGAVDTGSGTWDFHLDGTVDEPRIYSGEITQDSIQQIYQNPAAEIPQNGTYQAEHTASGKLNVYTDLTLRNATAQVTVDAWDGSTWTQVGAATYNTSGNKTLSVDASGYDKVRTTAEFARTDPDNTARLHAEGVQHNTRAPTADNSSASPTGGTVIDSKPAELSINVSDQDFATAQGDNVTVDWYINGSIVDTTSVTSNGTVTHTIGSIDAGNHTWHVKLTDESGETDTSKTFEFGVPGELKIYKETAPSELVSDNNLSLRVRFFDEGSEQVIQRTVSDGTVDFTGLPANKRYIVTVRANQTDKWTYRRIVIDSLIETQEIYLLNKSSPNSQVVFELDDPTGQFPPEQTTLYVEKPITKDFDGDGNESTQYAVIAGDTFGASASFPVILQQDSRYRLRVETNDGQSSRILGAYSVHGATTEELTIERIAPSGDDNTGSAFRATIEELSGSDHVVIRYDNPSAKTDYVEYEVLYENGSAFVPNTTRQSSEFADFYNITKSGAPRFTVNYHIVMKDGSETGGTIHMGGVQSIAGRFDIDPQVLSIISWITILSTMGLLVIVEPSVAPLGGVGMATALVIIGTVAIPMPLLGVSGAIAVFAKFGSVS